MGLVSLQLDIPEMIDIHRRFFLKRNGRGGVDKVGRGEVRESDPEKRREGNCYQAAKTYYKCVCIIVY